VQKLLSYIIKKSNFFIIIVGLITLVFGFYASKVEIDPDFYNVFPETTDRTETLFDKTGIEDTLDLKMMISVVDDNALSLEKLQLFHSILNDIENMERVESTVNPFNFFTFKKENGQFTVKLMTDNDSPPTTAEEFETFKTNLLSEPLAKGVVFEREGKALNAIILLKPISDTPAFMNEFRSIIKPLEDEFEIFYSGDIPISDAVVFHISRDLFLLAILSLIVIIFSFFISFRSIRSIFLPVATIIMGIIWGVGFIGIMGYKLSLVSVILPTFLLAIGSSYAVHLLNEYYRNLSPDESTENKTDIIIDAVKHSIHTIVLAGITTVFGFVGLMFTSISSLQEFGISISFGILSCVILSLFFLPALLRKMPYPKKHTTNLVQKGGIIRFVALISQFVLKYNKLMVLLFVSTIGLFIFLYPKIESSADYGSYFPVDDPVNISVMEIIKNAGNGAGQSMNITIEAPEGEKNYFLNPENLRALDKLENELMDADNVIGITSFSSMLKNINQVMLGNYEIPLQKGPILYLSRLFKMMEGQDLSFISSGDFITTDGNTVTLFMKIYNMETGRYVAERQILKIIETIETSVPHFLPDNSGVHLWGDTMILLEGGQNIQTEQNRASIISIICVFLLSWIVFKKLYRGLLAILPLIFAVFFNFIIMVIMKIPLDITTILVSNVAIGVGVDDALHFLLQYQKQRNIKGNSIESAVENSLMITGRPIILTTVTIVAGFIVLTFASFKPVVYFGVLVSLSLVAAMIATLLFIPSFILAFKNIKFLK